MITWERVSLDDHRLDTASQQMHRRTRSGRAAAEDNHWVLFVGHRSKRIYLDLLRIDDEHDVFGGHFRQGHFHSF